MSTATSILNAHLEMIEDVRERLARLTKAEDALMERAIEETHLDREILESALAERKKIRDAEENSIVEVVR